MYSSFYRQKVSLNNILVTNHAPPSCQLAHDQESNNRRGLARMLLHQSSTRRKRLEQSPSSWMALTLPRICPNRCCNLQWTWKSSTVTSRLLFPKSQWMKTSSQPTLPPLRNRRNGLRKLRWEYVLVQKSYEPSSVGGKPPSLTLSVSFCLLPFHPWEASANGILRGNGSKRSGKAKAKKNKK